MDPQKLNIITWNSRSLNNKLFEFKRYIYSRKPQVVCLQETWLSEPYLPSFINYKTYFRNRVGRGGGLAILVRNDLISDKIDLQDYVGGRLECQGVKIKTSNTDLTIVNMYNPNQPIAENEFRHYLNQVGNKFVLTGDFNAHHNLWDSRVRRPCTTAVNLTNSMITYDLELLTYQSMPTYIDCRTGVSSTIDLCLTTANIFHMAEIELGEDCGSDHCPIHISLEIVPLENKIKMRQKWKFTDEWPRYRTALNTEPVVEQPTAEQTNQCLTDKLFQVSDETFGRTREEINFKYNNTWWTPECERVTRARKGAKAILRARPTVENAAIYRTAANEAKWILKEAKENKWREYANSINSTSAIGDVWNKVKKLRSKYHPQNGPLLVGNNLITNTTEKANEFANFFGSTFDIDDNCPPHVRAQQQNSVKAAIEHQDDEYNVIFTELEMRQIISNLKGNSPGIDCIHNNMIKNLPDNYLDLLMGLINVIWTEGTIPKNWKIALIVPILKFCKSECLTESYRPISLLPCLGKVLERMVTSRLYWYVENALKLSNGQSGFRRRCNTTDQVARLEKIIRETYVEKAVCVVVFIDLKGAYDKVNHRLLLQKLLECGVKGRLLRYCQDFLTDRKFKVFYNGEYSAIKNMRVGVPQGAAISPLLFNIFISDIPDMDGITRTEYADDLALICKGRSIEECTACMQRALDQLYLYINLNLLQINHQKTVAMMFTKKRIQHLPLTIDQYNVHFVQDYKFLGVTFDSPNLNYQKHIGNLKVDCIKRLNLMTSISHCHWGSDKKMLLQIYDALVLSKLNYGAELYDTASNVHLSDLDVIQNKGLRIIIGARHTSPISSLQAEANRPPLHIQRKKLVLQFYNRFRNLPNHLRVVIELSNNVEGQLQLGWTVTTPPPLMVRALNLLRTHNLTELDMHPTPLINVRAPWLPHDDFSTFMQEDNLTNLSSPAVYNVFQDRCQPFDNCIKIFTDGSKITNNDQSRTAAAIAIPSMNLTMGWKLPNISIMSAELFGIIMALRWFVESGNSEGIIFTDSLSSILMMQNNMNKIHNVYKHEIEILLQDIKNINKKILICWIPSHRGIPGNDQADAAAKEATTDNVVTIPNISKLDGKAFIKTTIKTLWNTHWTTTINETGAGRHLMNIRGKVGHWPWASRPTNRKMETALARLRIGHCGLRAHMYRFGLTGSPLCDCGLYENVQHYLIDCVVHVRERRPLEILMQRYQTNLSLQNLLGGGEFTGVEQNVIASSVWTFIVDTGKRDSI
jgi:ribonuclease HI